jgi:peptidoglycan DL-endopeptidase CwlO
MRFLIFYIILTTNVYSNLNGQKTICTIKIADSLVNYSINLIGRPYQWGGKNENGFDCSGFVYNVFGHFNVNTPRSSVDFNNFGFSVLSENCRKGDIILFTGSNMDTSIVGHVGIIISDSPSPIRFIHSSSSKNHSGVTITEFENSNYPKRYIGVRRILY